MEVHELVDRAKAQNQNEAEQKTIDRIKIQRENIRSAEKTLKLLREDHKKFLGADVDDLELEDYEY